MAAGLPLTKIVLTPLAKSVLIPLGLSAGMSAAFLSSFGLRFAYNRINNFK